METKKQGICVTCHYQRNCNIKSGVSPAWECSEYQTATVFSSLVLSGAAYAEPVQSCQPTFKGLCASCELSASCQWVQAGSVIFHCEHYQ